nr:MAG TPA: hypothetical protein [Caudoviricetes sp.]
MIIRVIGVLKYSVVCSCWLLLKSRKLENSRISQQQYSGLK